jgi:hypothetical protein
VREGKERERERKNLRERSIFLSERVNKERDRGIDIGIHL